MSGGRLRAIMQAAERGYRPVSAMIELTHRCHLACSHCYLEDNHRWQDKARELSTAEAKSCIDQLHAAGCMFLTVTGGEVFLRRDLFDLLAHARSRGLAVTLFTTGTLLDARALDTLASLHLRGVELSLYSTDPSVHDGITGRAGSHEKTMDTLSQLLARQVPVSIKCPLMQSNFASYPALKALAQQLGISLAVDATVVPRNDGGDRPTGQRMDLRQLTEFYEQPEFRPAARVQRRLPLATDSICAIGKRSCVIGPFGDVYTCLGYRPPIGNLREQSFAAIWRDEGTLYALRRVRAGDVAVCSTCEKFSYCNRCAGMALTEDGAFDGPSAWSCHLAAAKERAAGLPVTPSAAERLGLVRVIERPRGFGLRVLRDPPAVRS